MWSAAELAACHLDIVLGNASGQAALARCQGLDPSTGHLNVTYYEAPQSQPCTVEATKPCAAEWEDQEYGGQDWFTKAPPASCTPCPGPQPTHSQTCKALHDAGTTGDGIYTLSIKGHDGNISAVDLYCDMSNGGWTLIGQISGKHYVEHTWLRSFHNVEYLQTQSIKKNDWASIDALDMAVHAAAQVRLSSEDGTKFVWWDMDSDRDMSTWWNHASGTRTITAADDHKVVVHDQNGATKQCWQTKYGVMPLSAHGGSYPAATVNTHGNTATRDLCMAVGVQPGGDQDGFGQNNNGYDAPDSDSDWPNGDYQSPPFVNVWLK